MAKQTRPIKEAAAPAAASKSTLADVLASGVMLVVAKQPDAAPAPDDAQDEQQSSEPSFEFDVEIFRRAIQGIPQESFAGALEAFLGEAFSRGFIQDGPSDDETTADVEQLAAQLDAAQDVVVIDEHARVRELLLQHKLPKAWQDEKGQYYFDEKAAQDAQATTVITPEV